MTRPFHTLDVFTHEPYSGNPLAVVMDASGLDDTAMLAMTREFNLSETVFILRQHEGGHRADIRIFTPAGELPFAGHPTIGTACLLAWQDGLAPDAEMRFTLGLAAGPTPCHVTADAEGRLRATLTAPQLPEDKQTVPSVAALAACLGLSVDAIRQDAHRPRRFGAPSSFCYVALRDARMLNDIVINPALLTEEHAKLGESHASLYIYAMGGRDGGDIRARMFAPGLGLSEDPATGSASVALAGVLMAAGLFPDGTHRLDLEQGYEMGRPSRIAIVAHVSNGALQRVELAGAAVRMSEGRLLR